jgi:hypothetical protein
MKIKKVNLSQTEFQSEEELKLYLRDLVLDYASQQNKIERDICKKDEAQPDEYFFPQYKKRYLPVFEAYCSKKKRVYGGKADSYGSPAKYDGIENYTEYSVELKNKNRAEVYFKTDNDFDAEYLFIVVRQSGVWRIDNYKNRWYNEGNLESRIL